MPGRSEDRSSTGGDRQAVQALFDAAAQLEQFPYPVLRDAARDVRGIGERLLLALGLDEEVTRT